MTRQDIIAMAREAGFTPDYAYRASKRDVEEIYKAWPEEIEKFAALVAAKERARLSSDVTLPEPQPVNESGSTMAITRWTIETPHGWVGAWDKAAITELLRYYGDRRAAAEREACRAACEAIADKYQESEGRKYPELKSDAQTGASDCEYAIRARGQP